MAHIYSVACCWDCHWWNSNLHSQKSVVQSKKWCRHKGSFGRANMWKTYLLKWPIWPRVCFKDHRLWHWDWPWTCKASRLFGIPRICWLSGHKVTFFMTLLSFKDARRIYSHYERECLAKFFNWNEKSFYVQQSTSIFIFFTLYFLDLSKSTIIGSFKCLLFSLGKCRIIWWQFA